MFKQFKVRLAVIFGILIAVALCGAVLAVLLTTSNQVERTASSGQTFSIQGLPDRTWAYTTEHRGRRWHGCRGRWPPSAL